ncbi:MAG: type I phosphomannose isomerase catalytic subunit [Bacteroidota bacterium]
MQQLYPLKFTPIYKEKLWGGRKLESVFSKNIPKGKIGESWEISGVQGDVSIISNGFLGGKSLTEVIELYKAELVGEKVHKSFGNEFPLLIKFLDADDDLSIQVHPDDELAKKLENASGKTEMWYIIQRERGSSLIAGFQEGVEREAYLKKLHSEALEDILKYKKVEDGEVYFIPAKTVHAIGKGILLAEIQQTSDTTYRIYDYNRVDPEGNKRDLHTEKALEVMEFGALIEEKKYGSEEVAEVVSCKFFCTNILSGNSSLSRDYSGLDSFVIFVITEGEVSIITVAGELYLSAGESVLIPASIKEVEIKAVQAFKILETYIP